MKKLSALKLKDIVANQLDVSEMGDLIGGVNEGIMLLSIYGCKNDVCDHGETEGKADCSSSSCEVTTCDTHNT